MSQRLVIHQNALGLRGDSVNAQNLSILLGSLFGIDSLILAPETESNSPSRIKEMKALGLKVRLYTDQGELWKISEKFRATHSYFLSDGRYSSLWIPNTRHLVHAVFRNFVPHGHVYAYVSEWLYQKAIRNGRRQTRLEIETKQAELQSPFGLNYETKITWVPHTVIAKPQPRGNFREKFNISDSSKIIARIGGFTQFDDQAAQDALKVIALKEKGIKIVLVNTKPFFSHPNILYLNSTADREGISELDKWSLYTDADLFLNGRSMGETFGYSIVEPLMMGKPVLAPDRLRHPRMDASHMHLLQPLNLTYITKQGLLRRINRLLDSPPDPDTLKQAVAKYEPQQSMAIFVDRFLST